jgi:HEAT repeat protein
MLVLAVGLMAQATSGNQPDERPEPDETQPDWIEATEIQPEVDGDWIRLEPERPAVPAVGAQAISALRAEAFAIDLAAKARALATLEDLHAENRLGPDDSLAVDLIAFLATESYDFQVRREGRVINDFPMIRAEAVRLLGSLGGAGATATLSRVLRYEDDPYVLSQAVIAVAQAASGPTPELLRTLTTLVNQMNALRRPDNALAIAIVNAVRDLHERSAGIDDPDLFRALISITQGGYSTAVRRAAVEVINTLRRQPPS